MIDQAGGAHPGIEMTLIRIGGPVPAPRAKGRIAHERLSDEAHQFLAIDGIIHAIYRENGSGTT